VRLYDEYLRRPNLIRLATWSRLECRPTRYPAETPEDYDEPRLASLAHAQSDAPVPTRIPLDLTAVLLAMSTACTPVTLSHSGNPFDIMAIVIAMSTAWSPVSNVYAATGDEPETVHESRRALLRDCVRRATAPE